MRFFWLGLWLVSSSWLFGIDYFFKANPLVWAMVAGLGIVLIGVSQILESASQVDGHNSRSSSRLLPAMTIAAVGPALALLSWPPAIGPAVLLIASILELSPMKPHWLRGSARGLNVAGALLVFQYLSLIVYEHATARSRELPWPLPDALAAMVRLIGVNAAADGSDLVLPTMRQTHRLAATWELFVDPATFCFLASVLVILALRFWLGRRAIAPVVTTSPNDAARLENPGSKSNESRTSQRVARQLTDKQRNRVVGGEARPWAPAAMALALFFGALAVWLPVRVALEVGFFLHRALRTDYEAPLNLMNQLWSPWPQLCLLLPFVLLTGRWLRPCLNAKSPWAWPPSTACNFTDVARLGAIGMSTAICLTLAVLWDPVGQSKPGRIAVDEHHSKWEPTDRPMDTEWYGHLSGYNYACLYDFSSRHYEMSRLTNSLTDPALAGLDVLIVKVPTEPFQPAEVDVVTRFVERGGGLLLIGEHTDVFGTGYHLNQLARPFGFTFRYDCLFGMESFFDQSFRAKPWRHPVLQLVDGFDFATSCSLDVRGSGHGVIVSTGLKNSMADYHANNYYPQAVDHAAMRAGAFVQLWATRRGNGRVVAFTDSTIFSNFSTFEPGKIELWLGMIEWLNHKDRIGNPRWLFAILGSLLLAWTVYSAGRYAESERIILATSLLGWSVTCFALMAYQSHTLPPPKPVRPLTWVMIDRTVCDGPLSKGGFIAGKPDGFGIFERWILRLGYFIKRVAGPAVFRGDMAVFFYPDHPVSAQFRQDMIRYVEGGGRVLVLDSPQNTNSTAGALLEPFGLTRTVRPEAKGGTVAGPSGWPSVSLDASAEIAGGKTLFTVDGKPVGAVARRGTGAVVAIGFGSRFCDVQMGTTGDVVPDEKLRQVFDLEYALVRSILRREIEGSR